MSYVPRAYDAIVRDLLTTLTGGTVREELHVPADDSPLPLARLQNRPVRRVSHLEGTVTVGAGSSARDIAYKFTSADFELISTSGDPSRMDAIRFRDGGRRPKPNTILTVNYYPVQTSPVPLTDLNVGSVVRTIMETVAREMATAYVQLDNVYRSAFLDTAEGDALDKVVALVGVQRLPAGQPLAQARFSRRTGAPGRITVPANTALTDAAGNRYLTIEEITLEPGETTREVQAAGEGPGTKLVAQGELNRLEVLVEGISEVTNPQPARRLSVPETDDELRRRTRGALHGVVHGTLDALRFSLKSIPGVNDVTLVEAPNGVYGEIRITVAYGSDTPDVRAAVAQTIEEFKPAGIRVIGAEAARVRVNVKGTLTLAGAGLSPPDTAALTASLEGKLADYLTRIAPGGTARRAQMTALILSDSRVVDAKVTLTPQGQSEVEEWTLEAGQTLDVVRPFTFVTGAEQAQAADATTSRVSATLPIHLAPGITLANASDAINLALNGFLATRRPDAPLTVDGLAAAIRDDTRFALVRGDTLVTVETADNRFLQLTDGVGSYAPGANETLQKGDIGIEPREGGV
jgi:uncharacterized phage protein gp47/JayE